MIAAVFVAFAALTLTPDPRCAYVEPQAIPRDAQGVIKRSTTQRARFVRMNPCPATGEVTGACPGWAVDHIVPLANGGADEPRNMQWLPIEAKACRFERCKDRFERRVYRCWL